MRAIALVVLGAGLVAATPAFAMAMRHGAIPVLAGATGCVLALSVGLAWMLDHGVLTPLGLPHLRTFGIVIVVATVVQAMLLVVNRRAAPAHATLGILLPLAAATCALLGVSLLDTRTRSFVAALAQGMGSGVAVAVALVLFAALRERMDAADVPASFRGAPIALLNAALVSLALVGVAGLDAG